MSQYEVSEVIGNSPKSIENLVNVFLEKGFEGLRELRGSGIPTRLSGMMEQIGLDLRKNPVDLGYSQNLWDGKLLRVLWVCLIVSVPGDLQSPSRGIC